MLTYEIDVHRNYIYLLFTVTCVNQEKDCLDFNLKAVYLGGEDDMVAFLATDIDLVLLARIFP